ncbi:MAG: hypothetical protein NPINA01_24240 [Nitrospinaceae bacterium]|nr:MAG: hypothetical protein NPINA01_24240 [Nitrospinaceae bacterium]
MANKNYRTGDAKTDHLIEQLADACVSDDCREMFRQILTTVTKLGMEHDDLGDFKLINTSIKELRHSFRIFLPYRHRRKVMVFGSARTPEEDPNYSLTVELSRQLVAHGFMIISGAGGGIMEAANRGAGKENSFGVNIKLPFEQGANPYIANDPKLMLCKYFFTRKLIFIKESDATVLLPGGFGTQDEGFENLTLFQTGKALPRPIVLLEAKGGDYWTAWLEFIDTVLAKKGLISIEDRKLFQVAYSAEEAAEFVTGFYRFYHSLRYVRNLTVIRFTREIPANIIARLNSDFRDILVDGNIEAMSPLEDELKNGEHLDLPRLVFKFNQRSFGRLNEMIHAINEWMP